MEKLNPDMIVLAREYRGLTQEELGKLIGASQATIAKIEGGVKSASLEQTALLVDKLQFPIDFFTQNEELLGFGSSAYFYRKKATISSIERKKIQSIVNILRINLKFFLKSIDIEASRKLPLYDLAEDFNGSATLAARSLRSYWNLPDGPIKNLTQLIESTGAIVVPVNFGMRSIDATSIRLNELSPIIFINDNLTGDRWRFTLAHELAHLVLHQIPSETMEEEADEFASEFLLPSSELKPHFTRIGKVRLQDLFVLKAYWKVSAQALLMKAVSVGSIDKSESQYIWRQIASRGYKTSEPHPLPKEDITTYKDMLNFFESELNFSKNEIAEAIHLNPMEVEVLHGVSGAWGSRQSHLRIVS